MTAEENAGGPGAPLTARDELDPGWAWARYEPSPRTPWGPMLAAHLLRRAGFGPTWDELQRSLARGPQATIDELLQAPASYAAFAEEFESHESSAARSGDGMVLDAWWLTRLCQSPWPLLERLTLFWHGHFAIRSTAVGNLKLMHGHVHRLRGNALSDFPTLLSSLSGDAAMYTGLGGQQNRKARPNLHFARAWLEALTVGPEVSTASEVANLARAWTGWFVYGGNLRFIEREHDQESKKLLGHEGNLGREDAVRLLAEHPATARNLAKRLFRAFVSEELSPPEALLASISERLAHKARVIDVLEMIFRSNLFFSEYAVARRVKSPVELAVGLVRSLAGVLPSGAVAEQVANLGQRLDEPPTVHGWAGGVHWINTISIAGRLQLCEALVRGSGSFGAGLDPAKVAAANGLTTPAAQARFLMELLLPTPPHEEIVRRITQPAAASPQSMRTVLERILAQPEFQLC